MNTLTINDLVESNELDRGAMAAMVGGHGNHGGHIHFPLRRRRPRRWHYHRGYFHYTRRRGLHYHRGYWHFGRH